MKKFDPANAALLDEAERLSFADPERILELLDLPPRATLLDFGTGTGVYAIEIAERRPDVHVIALDEQPVMLERLRAKPRGVRPNIEPRLPDVIVQRTGSVDRILALNVLHELEDNSLAALRSLLRPDGVAVVIDWNPAVERPRGPKADHLYTETQAVELLARFGLQATLHDGFPYHLAFVCRPV
jgi:cyclopropane fatty-acyl-phospholipid synthase-like methyltransferase